MEPKRIVVVTGLAGAGKSTAARALEDVGFFVVDNLPPQLIETLVNLADNSGGELRRIALVIDAREARFLKEFGPAWDRLNASDHEVNLLFLDASDEALVKRFKETRRKHPLDHGEGVRHGIAAERALLEDMQHRADELFNTTSLSVHQLKQRVTERFGSAQSDALGLTIMSFGFKHGLPSELDLCFDCRFLQNPYFVDELRLRPGTDPEVAKYVTEQPDSDIFLNKIEGMVDFLLPRFLAEGKAYVTTAIGCTGGRHRSVALAEALGQRLREKSIEVRVLHRDLDKPR